MWDNLNVAGFCFESSSEFAEAKREAESIEYICAKMDVENPQIALKVYYKLLERNNLHTIVGITFLKKLRDHVLEAGIISDENLKCIKNPSFSALSKGKSEFKDEDALENDAANDSDGDASDNRSLSSSTQNNPTVNDVVDEVNEEYNHDVRFYKEKEKKLKAVADYYRDRLKKMTVVLIALVVIIAALFGISWYKNSLSFDAEETAIQDKYSAWAEELEQKQQELDLREKSLLDIENTQ